jgi:Ca2+-binding RTX toxin-like protein
MPLHKRVSFEALEARKLLSVSIVDGVLRIIGTPSNDVIEVKYDPASDRLNAAIVVKFNGAETYWNQAAFQGIYIDGGNGHDNIGFNENDGKVGRPTTLIGGAGNDTIEGSAARDTIYGGPGHDIIDGKGQADRIFGEAGNDTIYGGTGSDRIDGGNNNDVIYGGDGNDFITGGAGNDYIEGGSGADRLDGGRDDDTILGQTGNDTIWGGPGRDSIDGGSGLDLIFARDGDVDTVDGGTGNPNEAEVDETLDLVIRIQVRRP